MQLNVLSAVNKYSYLLNRFYSPKSYLQNTIISFLLHFTITANNIVEYYNLIKAELKFCNLANLVFFFFFRRIKTNLVKFMIPLT